MLLQGDRVQYDRRFLIWVDYWHGDPDRFNAHLQGVIIKELEHGTLAVLFDHEETFRKVHESNLKRIERKK